MLLATFDGGRAIAAYMKMRAATYALASITNQYATIQSADMTAILGATSVVMAPYSSGTPAVVKFRRSRSTIVASLKSNGAPPKTPPRVRINSTVTPPTAMVVNSSYLILAEVNYTYMPVFGFFGSSSGITFSDSLYVTPRSVSCVVYVPQSGTC